MMLKRVREERADMVRQYVGKHWSEEGTKEEVVVNLIGLYVSTISRRLVAQNPRVMLSTFDRSMKPTVSAMQSWANLEIERLGLQGILERVIIDALFSIGICKVALADPSMAANSGWGLKAGEPFAALVDLDDWVYDSRCKDFREASFLGHRYRVPLDTVRDSNLYSKARKDLTPSTNDPYNHEGDERSQVFGQTYHGVNTDDWEDYVDLWELYLPRHRLILTLSDDMVTGGIDKEPLRVQQWLGPECGPYHILGYGTVPSNPMPKAPIQDLYDLHMKANAGWRKIFRTMERTKEVGLVSGQASEDGSRVIKADDGELINVNHPEGLKVVTFGGNALSAVIPVASAAKDLFGYFGGNLDAIGGLSKQSSTVGQDRMLTESASNTIADLQARTVNYVSDVVRALCWYWHHDPIKIQRSKYALPGLPNLQIERQVTPDMRKKGRFEDLDIAINPYSLQHQTPQSRMTTLNSVMQGIVMPLMPLLQQQGVSVDINAYLAKVAKYLDMPDLSDVVTIVEPQSQSETSAAPQAPKSPTTERTYNRVNTPSEPDGEAQAHMMPKPSEGGQVQ